MDDIYKPFIFVMVAVIRCFLWIPPLAGWVRRTSQQAAGRAKEAYFTGDLVLAETCYRQGLIWQPQEADLHSAIGQIYYEQDRIREAEKQFHTALGYDYKNPVGLRGLAVVLQEKGALLDAMYFYLRYLELEPKDPAVCHNLGVVFHNLGKYEKAIEYYKRAR